MRIYARKFWEIAHKSRLTGEWLDLDDVATNDFIATYLAAKESQAIHGLNVASDLSIWHEDHKLALSPTESKILRALLAGPQRVSDLKEMAGTPHIRQRINVLNAKLSTQMFVATRIIHNPATKKYEITR